MATGNSIYDIKKGFLSSQLRILDGALKPKENWQEKLPEGEHGDLSEGVLNQVLYKLNVVAKRHQKLVYSSQALRHVAEQIDDLYQKKDDSEEGITREDDVLRRGANLKDPQNIDLLPESYPAEEKDSEEDLEEYQTLKAKLANHSAALQAQRQRHAYYSQLKSLIAPFASPQQSVQPNLVTKDGPLAAELERTRLLAAKLAYQIEKSKFPNTDRMHEDDDDEMEESVGDRLRMILEQAS
ncbi:kinetochore Sim4 complex subunit Fta4 [Tuber borchii]|uniref:Kinetochore Sim4 complex subunit Fta4 n=1 Tax=Tuber borchii TaxID=42251 RepID=A0A2T6Z9T1_TUBBO|nr:kinetochore Sim4 complex subunit Fta4 [Tuber borchii]